MHVYMYIVYYKCYYHRGCISKQLTNNNKMHKLIVINSTWSIDANGKLPMKFSKLL